MKFEAALAAKDSVDELRRIAIELSANGLKQREVYLKFLAFHKQLQSTNRENEEAVLGDVMDMIVDAYSRHNLNLPK